MMNPIEAPEQEIGKEKLGPLKPVIVTSVTLGKELHAGHTLLLAVADLLRLGLASTEPIFLVNNNTGPRAAGALVTLAEKLKLGLGETAMLANEGKLPIKDIVNSYQNRDSSDQEKIREAMSILSEKRADIFAAIAAKTQRNLTEAGFNVKVVAESALAQDGDKIVESANPTWAGSGFIPLYTGDSLRILKRGGFLTATGAQVANLASLSKEVTGVQKPSIVFVDSSLDTKDAVVSFSQLPGLGKATAAFGAGFSLDGSIASGTKGEAITLGEILSTFKLKCPDGSLAQALRHLVLTRPIVVKDRKIPDLKISLFDFKNNESFIESLISCQSEAIEFRNQINELLSKLEEKIGTESVAKQATKTESWLKFLAVRTQSILEGREANILEATNKLSRLKDEEAIRWAIKDQGYAGKDLESKAEFYLKGPQALCVRGAHFRGILKQTLGAEKSIVSLSPKDFGLIKSTINFCLVRLGYET